MSAISSPTPVPPETPGPAALPRAPRQAPPRPRRWPWIVVVLLVAGCFAAYQRWLKPKPVTPAAVVVPTARVTSGPLEETVRVAGTTTSMHYANVRAPEPRGPDRNPLVLLSLIPSGTKVSKGDVLAQIDGRTLQDHIEDTNATVLTSEADIRKRHAEQRVDRSSLDQSLVLAKADWEKWKLEAGAAEIRTVIDRELLDLGVEETEAQYQRLQRDVDEKKRSHAAEIRILEITRERHVRHVGRHVGELEDYTVRAPMDGVAVRQQIFRGGEFNLVNQGDQLFPGMLFLKVMDTDRMELEARVNQARSHLIRIGQEARVGLDAFPGVQFKAKVYSIGALARGGMVAQYVREIPVRIQIEGSDSRLLPDLSGFADIVIAHEENTAQVPLAAVFAENGRQFVFVKSGSKFERRAVELGPKNHTHAAVRTGLRTGEEVALERPAS